MRLGYFAQIKLLSTGDNCRDKFAIYKNLTLKWSRGSIDPKISFRASAQKRRVSWRCHCLTFTCYHPASAAEWMSSKKGLQQKASAIYSSKKGGAFAHAICMGVIPFWIVERTICDQGVHRGPGGWPPGGGWKGEAPPCLRKFCIWWV